MTKGKKKKKLLMAQHKYAQRTISTNKFEAIQENEKFIKCLSATMYTNIVTTTDNIITTKHKNICRLMSLGKIDPGFTKIPY